MIIEGPLESKEDIALIKDEIASRIDYKNSLQMRPKGTIESMSKKAPKGAATPPVNTDAKQKRTALRGVFKKLKLNNKIDYPSPPKVIPEETKIRNIIFLLDGSTSMTKAKASRS